MSKRIDPKSDYGRLLRAERKELFLKWLRISLVFAITGFFVGNAGSLIYALFSQGSFGIYLMLAFGGAVVGFVLWWILVILAQLFQWALGDD